MLNSLFRRLQSPTVPPVSEPRPDQRSPPEELLRQVTERLIHCPVAASRCPFLHQEHQKLILDTDIGSDIDDALALLLLLHLERSDYELLGITTVYGNVCMRSLVTKRIMESAGLSDIPVISGSGTPLYSPRPIWHAGTEGLGLYSEDECRAVHAEWAARQPDARTRPEPSPPPPAATTAGPTATARAATASSTTTASAQSPQVPPVPVALPASHAVDEDAAARFICEQAEHYPGRVVVCSLGALTNVARALRLRPGVGALLQRVVFMGAGVRVTESDPKPPYSPIERTMPHRARASHNIRCDTEAARIVLGDPSVRVQVVSNDVTCRCWFEGLHSVALVKAGGGAVPPEVEARFPKGALDAIVRDLSPEGIAVGKLYKVWLDFRTPRTGQTFATCPHDPLTVAEALYPNRFVRYVPGHLLIDRDTAESDFVVDTTGPECDLPPGPPRHWVGVDVDTDAFHAWMGPLLTRPRTRAGR